MPDISQLWVNASHCKSKIRKGKSQTWWRTNLGSFRIRVKDACENGRAFQEHCFKKSF
jgi:hypothetical protein